ncbi:globin-coupled sensor protein [Sporolactobacillus terrae]|nr:globin-coupled sensor protein [Sporolactobacillus terrae]UAK15197.1 globin-coupled sensor protein [Sporolactobacillus terrae]BBN99550.1 methyl-accepting chemotaxis protein [Sporolactobacillus terrae]
MHVLRRKKQHSLLVRAKSEKVNLNIQNPDVLEKIEMLGLNEEDLQILKMMRPFVEKEMARIAHEFYAGFNKIDSLKKIIEQNSTVEKLSQTLASHVLELFSGVLDEAFLARRNRVGMIHYRIGLKPPVYMGAFQNLTSSLVTLVLTRMADRADAERMIQAINKMISFEQQVVLEAYDAEYEKALKKEYAVGREDLRAAIRNVSHQLVHLSEENKRLMSSQMHQFERVRETAVKRNELSQHAKAHAAAGQGQLDRLLVQVEAAFHSVHEMAGMVSQLEQSSNKIGRVIQLVKEISEQTHILAINSAIEAARAGEFGKGFAVVAKEIQKLADQTSNAMTQIAELIGNSTTVSHEVAVSLDQTTAIIQKGMQESAHTGEKFEGIIKTADQNSRLSQQTDQTIRELAAIIDQLSGGVETLVASAEQLKCQL